MADSTRTLRGCAGLAGALSGSAAIIASVWPGQIDCGCELRPPHVGAGGLLGVAAGACCAPPPAVLAIHMATPVDTASSAREFLNLIYPPQLPCQEQNWPAANLLQNRGQTAQNLAEPCGTEPCRTEPGTL